MLLVGYIITIYHDARSSECNGKNYLIHKNTTCFKYSKNDSEGYVKEISASSGIEVFNYMLLIRCFISPLLH
jgi:hypothetical protein